MPVTLRETGARLGEAAAGGTRRQITIIEAGWGSSGYYSRELLERDGPTAFPQGTQMFLDHPTRTEESDRPERSVRDLAARIASTPRMVGDALVAEAEVFEVWRPVIDSIASDIGLSIRALGESEQGEAGGRRGSLVTALTEGISVDFVTKAGAGGKVGQLIESARDKAKDDEQIREASLQEKRNVGHAMEAKIHNAFTNHADSMFADGYLTRPERIAASGAIGDGLNAFSESLVKSAPQLYQRDPYADPTPGGTTVTEAAAGGPTQEADMADEKTLAALQESVSKIETRLTETETKLTESETKREAAEKRADRAEEALDDVRAEKIVREATIEVDVNGAKRVVSVFDGLSERAKTRAVGTALAEAPPRTEDGKLDAGKLTERAVKAAKGERDYLAEHGGGTVRSLGGGGVVTTDATDEQLAEAFKTLGMTDNVAKLAAAGR